MIRHETVKYERMVESCVYGSPLFHISVIFGAVHQSARDPSNSMSLLQIHAAQRKRA